MSEIHPQDAGPPTSNDLAQPILTAQRIVGLDVLRGLAVLGILVMNIRAFAMINAAYMNPLAAGPINSAEQVVWWVTTLLADLKFMALFSLLFGAGIVLMTQRQNAEGRGAAALHYRRMAGLFVIGMVHAYVIWFGDILVTYALCGLWLFLLRKCPAWLLILIGVVMLLISTVFNLLLGLTLPFWPDDVVAEMQVILQPTAEIIAHETAAHRGGWWAQMAYRVPASFEMQTFFFAIWGLWRAGGVMLLGMALFKLGVLRGTASPRLYLTLIGVGLGVGLPLILLNLLIYPIDQRGSLEAMFLGSLGNYWGSLLVAMAYASGVMLIVRSGKLAWATRPLAAVGRMALTNYLAQSVICTLLFYGTLGHAGLFGRLGWVEQMGVVIVVGALQVAWSSWWLKRHPMGPMEKLWRRMSYGR